MSAAALIECLGTVTSHSKTVVSVVGDCQSDYNSLLPANSSLKNSTSPPCELNELNNKFKATRVETMASAQPEISLQTVTAIPPFLHHSLFTEVPSNEDLARKSAIEWMTQICHFLVHDLENYGICVVDNFIGRKRAEALHSSVVALHNSGVFVDGETVSSSSETKHNIRGDKITWIDGNEKTCTDVAYLISTLDAVIANSVRINKGNGELGQRKISGRTKVYLFIFCSIIYFSSINNLSFAGNGFMLPWKWNSLLETRR